MKIIKLSKKYLIVGFKLLCCNFQNNNELKNKNKKNLHKFWFHLISMLTCIEVLDNFDNILVHPLLPYNNIASNICFVVCDIYPTLKKNSINLKMHLKQGIITFTHDALQKKSRHIFRIVYMI